MTLRVRWLGRVAYRDAHAVQQALFSEGTDDYLLLLEHPHVYTMGRRGSLDDVLVPPESLGAELVATNRGGAVTYHGPGQLVGYPILSVPNQPGATPAYVHSVEQLVIDVCADLGLTTGRVDGYPGVWVDAGGERPRKICAIGVRRSRGRTMHGFAFNVAPDLGYFDHIVPCGIVDKGVTSLAAEGVTATMPEVMDAVVTRAAERWGHGSIERQSVAHAGPSGPVRAGNAGPSGPVRAGNAGPSGPVRAGDTVTPAPNGEPIRLLGRLAAAGVDPTTAVGLAEPKPVWLRRKAEMGSEYRELKRTMRSLDLITVCEEAGCPNIFECWGAGTATFMINGDRCTRACGFCLVDTRRPGPADPDEPERVAQAVATMGLGHAVVTAVARDDLPDGGAAAFASTITAVRLQCPSTTVEVLIPDFKGDPEALDVVFAARPDVLNHNLETVARLQRAVRPQASYARSLAVLSRAGRAGLVTKSGIILGMGETEDEVLGAMTDLRNVGCVILTLGQYLRPTASHLPVARWWHPDDFDRLRRVGETMGFSHVQASPLTRSSYHAREAAEVAATTP